MANLKTIQIIKNYKSPKGYYNGPAIKLGAGVLAYEAYTAASEAGYRVLGGTCSTVGLVGGYTQGGGHSLLSSLYGLSADNVLEWEVVTPKGQHIVATPHNGHRDLYYALSGGGGGTYGVVLSMTTRLHPDGPVGSATLAFSAREGDGDGGLDAFWDAVSAWHAYSPKLVDAGLAVFYHIVNGRFQTLSVAAPGLNETQVHALFQPFVDQLTTNHTGVSVSGFATRPADPGFLAHFNRDLGPLPFGWMAPSQLTGSRMIPRSLVRDPAANAKISDAMRLATASGHFYFGCGLLNASRFPHKGYENAVNPAWRGALSHCLVVGPWDFGASTDSGKRGIMMDRLDELTNYITPALEVATPGSGTYLNEANFLQRDWQRQFYGGGKGHYYAKLLGIKRRYDPQGLLYAVTAVGSEGWFADEQGRLCPKKKYER